MDMRAQRFEAKISKSNKTKKGFKYFEEGGSHDQPRSDKYKNHRRKNNGGRP